MTIVLMTKNNNNNNNNKKQWKKYPKRILDNSCHSDLLAKLFRLIQTFYKKQ